MDAEHHTNNLRDPFPSRVDTPRQILIGSFVVDYPFFANVVGVEMEHDAVDETLPLPANIIPDQLRSSVDEEGRVPVRERQLVLQQGRGERQLGEGGSRQHDGAERGGGVSLRQRVRGGRHPRGVRHGGDADGGDGGGGAAGLSSDADSRGGKTGVHSAGRSRGAGRGAWTHGEGNGAAAAVVAVPVWRVCVRGDAVSVRRRLAVPCK